MRTHQSRKHVDDASRADAAGYVDRQALVGEFIDYGKTLELLAVGAIVEHEVIRPDVVGGAGWHWPQSTRSKAAAWPSS